MSTEELPARDAMGFDVVIVGAGPAGLGAAIRLKQLNSELTVVVVEKGSEVGAHILSGAVIDPIGLDALLPGWRLEADTPIKTPVTDDRFYWLGSSGALRVPNFLMPPLMSNHGNYIVSLGNVCRWLTTKAEALGVEIYPGFAADLIDSGLNAVSFPAQMSLTAPLWTTGDREMTALFAGQSAALAKATDAGSFVQSLGQETAHRLRAFRD